MKWHTPTVYLAGPIGGLTYDGCNEWREKVSAEIAPWITAFNPLRGKQYLRDEGPLKDSYLQHMMSTRKAINTRDHLDCLTCDVIFANLLGCTRPEQVSKGTVMEIAWGFAYRRPVILVMEEAGNVHEHAMVVESASFVVPTLESGIDVLRHILLPQWPMPELSQTEVSDNSGEMTRLRSLTAFQEEAIRRLNENNSKLMASLETYVRTYGNMPIAPAAPPEIPPAEREDAGKHPPVLRMVDGGHAVPVE